MSTSQTERSSEVALSDSFIEPVRHPVEPEAYSLLERGSKLGPYSIAGQLASGGMATVYLARLGTLEGFQRLFALKVLHPHMAKLPEAVRWFLDEARIAGLARHYNVVSAVDASHNEQTGYYMVMEYIAGDPLQALLRRAARQGERFPVQVALRVLSDALAGLDAVHRLDSEKGEPLELVHRDVSPHNLLVGADGVSRLIDFGLAQPVRVINDEASRDIVAGKLAYLAPETAAQKRIDQRTDLFSMGTVLWEAITTNRLFACPAQAQTVRRIVDADVQPPSSVHGDLAPLDDVVARALAKEPADRFECAEAFTESLHAAARKLGGLAPRRQVRALVAEYSAEKLQRERDMGRFPVVLSQPVAKSVASIGDTRLAAEAGQAAPEPVASTARTRRHRISRTQGSLPPPPAGAVPKTPLADAV